MKSQQNEGDLVSQIRSSILSGRYSPNERLIETTLAELYKTNRTNIRNALTRLEHERLVLHEPNRGARVRQVTPYEAVEIIEVRGALEMLNARRAAERANEADKQRLHGILNEMEIAVRDRDYSGTVRLNNELHERISEISANQTAERFVNLLLYPIVRIQYGAILLPGRPEEALAEHAAIIRAIIASDPDAAMKAMRQHFDGVLAALQRTIAIAEVESSATGAHPD